MKRRATTAIVLKRTPSARGGEANITGEPDNKERRQNDNNNDSVITTTTTTVNKKNNNCTGSTAWTTALSSAALFIVVVVVTGTAIATAATVTFRLIDLDISPEIHLQALVTSVAVIISGEEEEEEVAERTSSSGFDVVPAAANKLKKVLSSSSSSIKSLLPPFVIFYNIYLPSSRRGIHNTHEIIQEQLGQIGKSLWKLQSTSNSTGTSATNTLFYNTIGSKNALPGGFMRQVCAQNRLECVHVNHYMSGYEELTLQSLYQFCTAISTVSSNSNTTTTTTTSDGASSSGASSSDGVTIDQDRDDAQDFRVVYIHSKGSYHKQHGTQNDNWRRHMTSAVISKECLWLQEPSNSHSNSSSTCNVCGLLFYPLWTFFFPGNFWTAKCSYVSNLMSPIQFRQRMTLEVIPKMKLLKQQGKLTTNLYPDVMETGSGGYLGVDRYAAEHWVASHPNIQPCDVSQTSNLIYWWNNGDTNDNDIQQQQQESDTNTSISSSFRWNMAPRFSYLDKSWFRLNQTLVQDLVNWRSRSSARKEYFWLSGYLYKFYELYGQIPPATSWIWSWFPNGHSMWKELYREGKDRNITAEVIFGGNS